jgi:putative ABC transport system permease protein
MPALLLFHRLILRPLLRDRVRTALAILTVALGVGLVLAIELAGEAAAGSFRSSVVTLGGQDDFEVTAVGGIPPEAVGALARLPLPIKVTPRILSTATVTGSRRTFIVFGVDVIAETTALAGDGSTAAAAATLAPQGATPAPQGATPAPQGATSAPQAARAPGAQPSGGLTVNADGVFVPASLGKKVGDRLDLVVNGRPARLTVAGVLPPGAGDDLLATDIATADRLLGRAGRVDRLLVRLPEHAADGAGAGGDRAPGDPASLDEWETRLRAALPAGVDLRRQGASTEENRRMLRAFRWNLRVLSYVSLIVGAFLIYNTISVSVVRRRAEIGAVRALGASRRAVLLAFLAEAAVLGTLGALVALPLGRFMASGAVVLIGATVNALYVSSRPGDIALGAGSVGLALAVGLGVAVLSALSPAREASMVSPLDAMGRGRREFVIRVRRFRDLALAAALAAAAFASAQAPPVGGIPVFGYAAAVLSVAACGFAIPALVAALAARSSRLLGRVLGVEALLAARSLSGSLRRTSVLVAALATAVAMTTSVGIMVGSFRETVLVWLTGVIPADLYVGPAGPGGPDRHLEPAFADRLERLAGVAAVDRFRGFTVRYGGRPVTLAFSDMRVGAAHGGLRFLSGRPPAAVLPAMIDRDEVIVSEPFAYKNGVRAGDLLALPLGGRLVSFRVADVYYDYTGERGFVLADRSRLLHYLPNDSAPATLAVYLAPGVNVRAVRTAVAESADGTSITVASNGEIRQAAVTVFDRTFAITYALEAVSVFVAVMGVAGALLALVIDRRRELGLLRFLGATRGQVRRLILFEAGLLGLLANLAGLLLGIALSLLLVFVINKQSFGWTIQYHWPPAVLVGGLTVVYVATVLSAIYPAHTATRLDPIEVVHEE